MAYEACLEYLCLVEKRLSSVVLSVSGHRSCAFLCSIPLYKSIWCSLHHYSNYLLAYILYTVLVLGMKWSKNIPWATKLPGLVILAHPGGVMALWNGSILFFSSLDSNQEVAFLPKEEKYNPSYCLRTVTKTGRGNTDGDRWLRLEKHLQSQWKYAISGLPFYISSHIGITDT